MMHNLREFIIQKKVHIVLLPCILFGMVWGWCIWCSRASVPNEYHILHNGKAYILSTSDGLEKGMNSIRVPWYAFFYYSNQMDARLELYETDFTHVISIFDDTQQYVRYKDNPTDTYRDLVVRNNSSEVEIYLSYNKQPFERGQTRSLNTGLVQGGYTELNLSYLPDKITLPIDQPWMEELRAGERIGDWPRYNRNDYALSWLPGTSLRFYDPEKLRVHPVGSPYPEALFQQLLQDLERARSTFEPDLMILHERVLQPFVRGEPIPGLTESTAK